MKPPYQVPSMAEISAVPWNGLTAISTFSGCGGSSLGYRMAGFKVAWASEFIEAARDTYRANAPGTTVDGRDIREVTGADVLTATGLDVGQLDLLDGSPPCASFSTAGKRHAGWGKVKKYSDTAQRTDDLFYEYARLVRELQPRVFVAENVSGLVKGSAKGYFIWIMQELRACGYRVQAKLLDAQWLGVPQARQRLIFVGVREDLDTDPAFPVPLPYRYSVRDALAVENGPEYPAASLVTKSGPRPLDAPTVQTHGRPFTESELTLAGLAGPIQDPETGKDITIGRYAIGREWERLQPGGKSDRYQNLVRPDAERPAPTVTARGGGDGVAAVTHPVVARKFTLGELRRICGFPDDFALTGTYEQRWERLGRAVPPVMMAAIAAAVRDRILLPTRAPA